MKNQAANLSYPRLCGLAGTSPSRLSQAMHNAAFAHLGLPFTYVAFDTSDTDEVFRSMRSLGIRGLSLTIVLIAILFMTVFVYKTVKTARIVTSVISYVVVSIASGVAIS